MSTIKIDIGIINIFKILGVLFGLYLLWQIRDILFLLLVVLMIVAAINPTVQNIMKLGIPRIVAVLIIYTLILSAFTIIFSLIIPPLIVELRSLAERAPTIFSNITPLYNELLVKDRLDELLRNYSTQLTQFTQGLFAAISQIFGGAIATIMVIVLSFYLLIDMDKNRKAVKLMVPDHIFKDILVVSKQIDKKIGQWVRGQLILSFVIGLVSYLGLLILGVPFALTLGILAGILEVIPVIGPIVAGLIAVFFAYSSGSWPLVLAVIVFYTILQQLENTILVPKIMHKAVGLSPVIIIIVLAVGAKLAGIAGAILAIPIATAISVLIQQWHRLKF